jgi:hypothetical protein
MKTKTYKINVISKVSFILTENKNYHDHDNFNYNQNYFDQFLVFNG